MQPNQPQQNQRHQRGSRNQNAPREEKEFDEKVIQVSRVSKKTKGGNKMGFSVLIVVGDKKGRVGLGLGKAADVVGAIRKGVKKAKKHLITVPMDGTTIPFRVDIKYGAGKVMLKPAPKGSGIIAGGAVRAVVDAAGIRDISSKILGSSNQASSVYATFEALKKIEQMVQTKGLKLRSIAEVEREEKLKLQEEDRKMKENASKQDIENSKQKEAETHSSKVSKPKAVKKQIKTQSSKVKSTSKK